MAAQPHTSPRRRFRLWIVLAQLVAAVLGVQAVVLGVLAVLTARRWRRRADPSFPYVESHEVTLDGNRLQLYSYGQEVFDAMLDAIDRARDSIFVESFIWKGDATGQAFKNHLARKVAEGVKVYVIFDSFGNLVVPPALKQFPPGVHVLRYSALTRPWHLLDPRRYALDHRKIAVVDGTTAFVGGYNIGALYATQWRDTHLRIVGPEAAELAQSFVDFWNRYAPHSDAISLRFARRFEPAISLRTNDAARLIFPIRDMYIGAIDRAEQHIYITNAYFIPDGVLLSALIDAARRGVDVQILLPWHSNHIAADWAARGFFAVCLAAGIRIFAYTGVMIHAKTCTIDGVWSTLGTANLDRLSEIGNHEINVEIFDAAFAREMESLFACDKTNAFELTRDRWTQRPWYVKLSEFVLSPLRPAL